MLVAPPLRAFTVLEQLTVITLSAMLLLFSAAAFRPPPSAALQQEIRRLQTFFYQLQTLAAHQQQNYAVQIAQNEQRWCIAALKKSDKRKPDCNCLLTPDCRGQDALIFHNSLPQVRLSSKSLYPKTFTDLDGNSGQLSEKCLNIAVGSENEVLQFKTNGMIYVAPKSKRTSCKS